ncbi:MAG: metallophosphoesterase [Deltaproteobacteria bacterium]|nr:metallophosphoesterase [Deltaproteobacteria bacterium]
MPTIAHVSDLHIGKSAANDEAARALAQALLAARVDEVLVSGDVTHRGRVEELRTFRRLFAPLRDRVALVPGNHDRLGDDAGRWMMAGRVQVRAGEGLHLVRVDSTAPHNRHSLLDGHGELSHGDVAQVEEALAVAAPGALTVVMLHHHLHELPEDGFWERVSTRLGWPNAGELALGEHLLGRLLGRCDLVLHGHRHATSESTLALGSARPLRIFNAGASPELGRVRVLRHGGGRLRAVGWLDCRDWARQALAWEEGAPAAA